jgi:glycosyltransferase involved in cell wall biosynthesis
MRQANGSSGNSRSDEELDATEHLVAEITAGLANRRSKRRRSKQHQPHQLKQLARQENARAQTQEIETARTPVAPVSTPVSAPVVQREPEAPKPAPAPAAVASAPAYQPSTPTYQFSSTRSGGATVLAVFCCDEPGGAIATYLTNYAGALAARGITIHIFSRKPIPVSAPGIQVHPVGPETTGDLLLGAKDFAAQAAAAFEQVFPRERSEVILLGHEWMAIPALTEISSRRRLPAILSMHSLESQRSDMQSEFSRAIQQIEASGLRGAHVMLVHDVNTGVHARNLVRECEGRIVHARIPFTFRPIVADLDPGAVKARFHVGPIDPTILFIGELDERHGPDVLMKAIPAILKNHNQARFIFVGDGALQWPLRVHARYLLLEHAVRIVGHLSGDPLFDLIQSVDVVAVPSRIKTEDWPVLAAWATKRPVVATHNTAGGLLKHDVNSVLCYPAENSFVWGVDQVLFNEELRKKIVANGQQQLEEMCGWNTVAAQIESMMATLSGVAHG